MSEYMTAASKEILILLSGEVGSFDVLIENGCRFRNGDGAKEHIEKARTELLAVMDKMVEGLDTDALIGIRKQAKSRRLICATEGTPEKDEYRVSADDMQILLNAVMGECYLCSKKGDEARRCQTRCALLRSGVSPMYSGESGCPYQG